MLFHALPRVLTRDMLAEVKSRSFKCVINSSGANLRPFGRGSAFLRERNRVPSEGTRVPSEGESLAYTLHAEGVPRPSGRIRPSSWCIRPQSIGTPTARARYDATARGPRQGAPPGRASSHLGRRPHALADGLPDANQSNPSGGVAPCQKSAKARVQTRRPPSSRVHLQTHEKTAKLWRPRRGSNARPSV